MAAAGAGMAASLLAWSAKLTRDDVTADGLATAIGQLTGGAGTSQLTVRPRDEDWATAEVISRSPELPPSIVRLVPAGAGLLTVADLDAALGAAASSPPRVHFDDPVSRLYEIDTGEPAHTAVLIADLAPGEEDHVAAVVLRRDIRL